MRSLAKGEHADIAHDERGWLRDIAALCAATMYRGGGSYGQHPPHTASSETSETEPTSAIPSIDSIELIQRLISSIRHEQRAMEGSVILKMAPHVWAAKVVLT